MQTLPHTKSCFVCGESNPIGLRLHFETDGRLVRAVFTPRPEHIGFRQVIHGGLLATLLDEIMVWACAVQTRRFAFCAEMNVRYVQPARPGEAITATAELTGNRRNRLFEAAATLRNAQDIVLATATGKYLPIPPESTTDLLDDLVGDWEGWGGGCEDAPGVSSTFSVGRDGKPESDLQSPKEARGPGAEI